MGRSELYEWEEINLALMQTGFGPRVILNILSKLNKIRIDSS